MKFAYKFCFYFNILLYAFYFNIIFSGVYDVTVVGPIKFEDARARLPIGFIDILKDDLRINFIPIKDHFFDLKNLSTKIKKVILNRDKRPGNVAILFSSLCLHCASFMPDSFIKLVYSTFESSSIPQYWIEYANKNFDGILVPDKFLLKAYKKSGINIPVFLAPHGLYLDDFLNKPIKSQKNDPFVFGMSAGFWPHKNHELLIRAFLSKFENNNKVLLKIHGYNGNIKILSKIQELVKDKENIKLINKQLTQEEFVDFMSSLDCYVLVSKGEGFSVTPREAIALGIPSIISNNTAHKFLCKTSYFVPVKSDVKESSNFNIDLGVQDCGYNFNSRQEDLEYALEDLYLNYDFYLSRSVEGRKWVEQYLYKNLKIKYLNFIRPKKIILGSKNYVDNDYLMTSSNKLYEKYLTLNYANLLAI